MHNHSLLGLTGLCLLMPLAPQAPAAQAPLEVTTRASVGTSGFQGNKGSSASSISADGRFVAFASFSNNLVPGDVNGVRDIFVHDSLTGVIERVSVSSTGVQGDKSSAFPSISADGRMIAFASASSNLVIGDINGESDIFVHDRLTNLTERVSVSSTGVQADTACSFASISGDGNVVAFRSNSSLLVAGDTNGTKDIFVHDRLAGTTERASVSSSGAEGAGGCFFVALSDDGRFAAFDSSSDNLVPLDTNGARDIFVRDRLSGTTERVSVATGGVEGNGTSGWPSISGDGGVVAFESYADNLVTGDTNGTVDIFAYDRVAGELALASRDSYGTIGNGASTNPEISDDGRTVVFESFTDNLVPGDGNLSMDILAHDLQTGLTERVSCDSSGNEGNDTSLFASVSADGRFVSFYSSATNLVAGDTNGVDDVFVHDRMTGGPQVTLTNVVGGQLANLSITGATPGGAVVLGVSLSGQGPMPSPWGPLELSGPIFLLTLPMDAAGQLSLPVGIPAALTGLPLWIQGIDVTMDYPTTAWGGLIL